WEEDTKDNSVKWKTLEHKGPLLAPPYERLPSNVQFYYDGQTFPLSDKTEEAAGFYAKMLDHDYTQKKIFNDNFWTDFRKEMTPAEKNHIKVFSKCDFSKIAEYYKMKAEERRNMSKEEKNKLKKENEELMQEYGFCIIDGHRQRVGNFKIEPPGLFRGRGDHPKQGKIKRRIEAKDIIINIGKDAKLPAPPPGQKWKEVRYDNKVTWLASWTENINGSIKYIMLNPTSKIKAEKDYQKYETARKLKRYIDKIRQDYKADWKSKEMRIRQRSAALYFIDRLALRAGHEKEEGESADTVGCCSLRYEHIKLHDQLEDKMNVVEFDFLGKDSIRYVNQVPVEKQVYKNLKLFCKNKKKGDDLFDRLSTTSLNKYLSELMEGLTAKVFRTYNASYTLQEQLHQVIDPKMSIEDKILIYNRSNRAVAILCNHQRTVSKTFDKQMSNLREKIEKKEQQLKEAKKEEKRAKSDLKERKDESSKKLYEKRKKKTEMLNRQLHKLNLTETDKVENKEVALSTSKLNYMDPRISVAWCKKNEVPVEKVFNKTQREKFKWAIEMASEDYVF
ncbi:uncharacterized protein TRIADDRAFT_30199, partial [Trichoplax adhaerens]